MSEWIQHVKRFQEANGCSYKDALKHASATYQKGSGLRGLAGQEGEFTIMPVTSKPKKLSGMGSVGTMLKKSSAENVVKLLNSGTDRAVRAIDGSSLFFPNDSGSSDTNFSKQGAIDSANYVSSHQRGFKGLGINRLNKANRWQTFVDAALRDTIDTAGKAGRVYNDTTSPLSQLGFGLKRHKRLSGKALLASGY
jgi:hypothetical protein